MWITFIGLILVLVGLYGSVRTIINLVAFDKYPQGGVLTFNFAGTPQYYQQERDCTYPLSYYAQDGKPRAGTDEEKKNEQKQKENCLEGVKDTRNQAKINDISQSLLFLFLGLGVLVTRKVFFK